MWGCKACRSKDEEITRFVEREKALLALISVAKSSMAPLEKGETPKLNVVQESARKSRSLTERLPAFAGALVTDGHLRSLDSVRPRPTFSLGDAS
jgi:hypothetical protein